jgi:hypothetical protein
MRGIMDRRLGRVRRGWRRLRVERRILFFTERTRKAKSSVMRVLGRHGYGVSDVTNLTHGMMMTLPTQPVTYALSAPLLTAKFNSICSLSYSRTAVLLGHVRPLLRLRRQAFEF